MKVSDYIAWFLEDRGVPFVFEMSGGMITHMLDSLHRRGRVRIISMHHEQSASFAADAVGRLTGVPGVAMATSGPGATNLLTGIGSCYFDSSPAVFISGQVNRHEQKGNRPIRQLGFQETDIVSMAGAITKAAWQVRTPEEVPEMLRRAFSLAVSGRPGPVLLDIPMDVQRADIPFSEGPSEKMSRLNAEIPSSSIDELLRAMGEARRPLILAGAGIRAGGAFDGFNAFLNRTGVPVVHSLLGVDAVPYTHPQHVGMIGSYGNRWVNLAVSRSDFVLVLGSRLDIRQTGADTDAFKGGRSIFHVDCEAGEINNRVLDCVPITAELATFFTSALGRLSAWTPPDWLEWRAEIEELRRAWPDTAELKDVAGVNPNVFMHELSAEAREAGAYVVDVGQHQMWAAQSLEIAPGQRFLTSGGMGAMGFALPASIGAALALAPRSVFLIAGDGGFQTNIQELETVARNRLPIKMVVINNGCHGMVRQFQQAYFESRYQSTFWGYSAPDFARVAEAYGIPGWTVRDPGEVGAAVHRLAVTPGPALLQVMVETEANAYPKLAFGRPISEMEPFATPLEMEGT